MGMYVIPLICPLYIYVYIYVYILYINHEVKFIILHQNSHNIFLIFIQHWKKRPEFQLVAYDQIIKLLTWRTLAMNGYMTLYAQIIFHLFINFAAHEVL